MPNGSDDLDDAINDAAAHTDAALAGRIAGLTRLTDDEIMKICPTPADTERLAALMRIVTQSTDETNKANDLVTHIKGFAPIVVRLLGTLA